MDVGGCGSELKSDVRHEGERKAIYAIACAVVNLARNINPKLEFMCDVIYYTFLLNNDLNLWTYPCSLKKTASRWQLITFSYHVKKFQCQKGFRGRAENAKKSCLIFAASIRLFPYHTVVLETSAFCGVTSRMTYFLSATWVEENYGDFFFVVFRQNSNANVGRKRAGFVMTLYIFASSGKHNVISTSDFSFAKAIREIVWHKHYHETYFIFL